MIKLLGKRKSGVCFLAEELKESNKNDGNPGRGWYRLYTFVINEPVIQEELKAVCCKEEQLALVLIDIGNYRDQPLDLAALENLNLILDFFRAEKKELILRFLYDREGKGMEKEPFRLQMIQKHMKQTGSVVKEHADIIFTLQGLFIGSWGEMHSSRYLTAGCIKILAGTMYDAVAGSCRLAVRKPQFIRMLFTDKEIQQQGYIGLYNDGMLASESDLGTYGTKSRAAADWQEPWCRQDELEFQNQLCQRVPNGGEAVAGNWHNDIKSAAEDMQKMHITYLHSLYDRKLLDKWRAAVFEGPGAFFGVNGYDYIGAHLGYRFFVCAVYLEHRKREAVLTIEIKNTGFAEAYEKMDVFLLFMDSGRIIKQLHVATDVRDWRSGEITTLSIELRPVEHIKKSEVQIQIQRAKDKTNIRLANEGAGKAFTLGYLF